MNDHKQAHINDLNDTYISGFSSLCRLTGCKNQITFFILRGTADEVRVALLSALYIHTRVLEIKK